ncbi:MAG: glycosyl transferase [Chthoniobacterales bacterium]
MVYLLYHRPIGRLKTCIREGGPIEQWKTERGRRAMEQAAYGLTAPVAGVSWSPSDPSRKLGCGLLVKGGENSSLATSHTSLESGGKPLEVHVLTGKNFWYQTAFCLWSLAKASGRGVLPHIYDDGSMQPEHVAYFEEKFANAKVVKQEKIIGRLDQFLPESKFPRLRERWLHYPNIRKLTDPHVGEAGWKLVIDSDLLFFRSPDALLRWADYPDRPLHAVDSETSYGYPLDEMSALAGHQVVERLNVGLCGLKSKSIDWEQLEYWCEELISKHGTHYYLEQALVAMMVAGKDCAVLSPDDYVTLPREPEASGCKAVMHHYVSSSKPWYFRTNWQRVLSINS